VSTVRYTQDGRIPIDKNVIERLLRPVAIGRKNYLHFGSEEGGKTGATLYTLGASWVPRTWPPWNASLR
jgi:transposase